MTRCIIVLAIALTGLAGPGLAPARQQEPGGSQEAEEPAAPNVTVDPSLIAGLSYRSTGFTRGGRSTAVAGIPGQPDTFFAGCTGGGVWKTTDAGTTWENQLNVLYGAVASGNPPVTGGVGERWADLRDDLQPLLDRIQAIYDEDLAAFNDMVGEHGLRVLMPQEGR